MSPVMASGVTVGLLNCLGIVGVFVISYGNQWDLGDSSMSGNSQNVCCGLSVSESGLRLKKEKDNPD